MVGGAGQESAKLYTYAFCAYEYLLLKYLITFKLKENYILRDAFQDFFQQNKWKSRTL